MYRLHPDFVQRVGNSEISCFDSVNIQCSLTEQLGKESAEIYHFCFFKFFFQEISLYKTIKSAVSSPFGSLES